MEQLHDAVANCNPVSVIKSFRIYLAHTHSFKILIGISQENSSSLGLLVALSVVLVVLVILVPFMVVCSVAMFIFIKDRAKLKRQLEVKTIIYEEIDIKGQSLSHVDTTENIAYAMHEVS